MKNGEKKVFEDTVLLVSNIAKMYHYDQNRNSRVKCDNSHSGLGAALEQELPDGSWVPIGTNIIRLEIPE